MSWTDERVELLRQLWLDGKSASQISAELGLGITRNAVIGKVHRLGLVGARQIGFAGYAARSPAAADADAAGADRPAGRASGGGGHVVRGNTALAFSIDAAIDAQPRVSRRRRRADVAAGDDRRAQGSDVPLAAGRSDHAGISLLRHSVDRAPAPIARITARWPISRRRIAAGSAIATARWRRRPLA